MEGANRKFTILAARYGAGLTWLDRTEDVRKLVIDPTVPFEYGWAQAGSDPWFGVPKFVAVWFDHQDRRYVRVFPEGQCVLLP